MRYLVIGAVIIVVLGCYYLSQGTFETVSAMVGTAEDLFFPKSDPKPTDATAASDKPKQPASLFVSRFSNSLMQLQDGEPGSFDSQKLSDVKYWAFYYSASWCPPCRAFTPSLVTFYREFKPTHPNFELIFVNLDRNQDDMLSYMKNDGMRWPAIWFADIHNPELEAMKYCPSGGIPCLTLVNEFGDVISTSEGRDPHEVMADIQTVVK